MEQTNTLALIGYSLNYGGLQLSWTSHGQKFFLIYDPCATCEFLKGLRIIEDFTLDKNGEPVIMFTDSNKPEGYGFALWCSFIKSYPFQRRHFEIFAEDRTTTWNFKNLQRQINYTRYLMYHPKKTA